MTLLLAVGLAVGAYFILEALLPRAAVAERVGELVHPTGDAPPRPSGARLLRTVGAELDPFVQRLSFAASLDKKLTQAGLAWTPGEFVAIAGGAALGLGALAFLLVGHPLAGLGVAAATSLVPGLLLGRAARRRIQAVKDQLPDAILLLANALRAGNSFLQALQILARQAPDPLAAEIKLTLQEINWGIPFETALVNFKNRIETTETEMVVVASLVQRQTGGNLSEILMNVHDAIRDRIRVEGELRAITAQGRYSGGLLVALPFALGAILFALNPGYIGLLFSDPRGQSLLAGAVLLQLVGGLLIRRIVRVSF
ncbi:MAG: type II secretion system F family protein [Candidatus Sericytochromatia bacterium]|nr:type II secretion system F family protein [Candidatus Tanganyikabacteria bacterium]